MGDYGYVLPTVFEDAPLQLCLSQCASTNRGNDRTADCKELPGCANNLHDISRCLKIPRISIENNYQDIDILKPTDNAMFQNNHNFPKTFPSNQTESRKSSDYDLDQDDRNGSRNPSLYLDVSDLDVDSARNSTDNLPFQSQGLFTKRPLPELPYNDDFEDSDLETLHWILRSKKVLITCIIVFFAFSTLVFGGLCMTHHSYWSDASTTTTASVVVSSFNRSIDITTTTTNSTHTSSTEGSTQESETSSSSTVSSSLSTQSSTIC